MIDRYPKKRCKFCGDPQPGHFPYTCQKNPKVIARRQTGLKRTPIKKVGKRTQQWFDARTQWINDNPPTIQGKYWMCYLQIHEWCPVRLTLETLTLDHVIARSSDPALRTDPNNLRPACEYCNNMKGSKSLAQVIKEMDNKVIQSLKQTAEKIK